MKNIHNWKEKYEDLEKYIRFIGKQIPCNTGGTFENDPIDAILDAAVRALHQKQKLEHDIKNIHEAVDVAVKEYSEHNKLAHDKTLDSLEYAIERTKVFEALAEMLYKAGYDNADGIKKIYETVREKYPVAKYYPGCKKYE